MRRLTVGGLVALAGVVLLLMSILQAGAVAPGNQYFQRSWARTDQPVASGQAVRTWMWGPDAFTNELQEPYSESPSGQRSVQYFDKARMEISQPTSGDPNSIWYVTNGLLVVELITGRMQIGDANFTQRQPATVNVAGDADDPTGPTYASFAQVLGAAPLPIGSASAPFVISQAIDRNGGVIEALRWANYGIGTAQLDEVTQHTIAEPFWAFMNATGIVYENGNYVSAGLFENPYFATGRPITEAYWASVKVGGGYQDVLMQCFERRCLTYNPANAPEWRVEAGNVGRHYYAWRYSGGSGSPTATASASPSVTSTQTASSSPTMTGSATEPTSPTETAVPVPAVYGYLRSWGSAISTYDKLGKVSDVAIDPDGDVWTVDTDNDRISEFDATGRFKRSIGTSGSGPLQFNTPLSLTVAQDGTLYVAGLVQFPYPGHRAGRDVRDELGFVRLRQRPIRCAH